MLRSLPLMSSPRLPGNRRANRVRDVGQQALLDERLMGDVALVHNDLALPVSEDTPLVDLAMRVARYGKYTEEFTSTAGDDAWETNLVLARPPRRARGDQSRQSGGRYSFSSAPGGTTIAV